MFIKQARIKNYRLLKAIKLSFDKRSTLIVGRNNTGKTSLAEIFRTFLSSSGPKVRYEDFNQACLTGFEEALLEFQAGKSEVDIRPLIPSIELELLLDYTANADDYGVLGDFIIDLDESLFETSVLASYQLKDGRMKDFFQNLDPSTCRRTYFSSLKQAINDYFEAVLYAIDPTNPKNRVKLEFTKLNRLLLSEVINAQRGLDDETHNEKDVLGKSLGKIFNSASSVNAPDEFKEKSDEIKEVVDELQLKIDTDFQAKVKQLLPALETFGYPGLNDTQLGAATHLNVKSLLESNTRVFYERDDHFTLPETYNGLGFRNLIFILFRVYEFFREYQSANIPPKGHIIFIEEPEAHLHPQMQEVFVRQLDKIVEQFQQTLNDGHLWPVQFVVSTHSSHIANEADFSKVRYFLSKQGGFSQVKDLNEAFKGDSSKEDKEFLHKYLTLTKCDLYFADKAILIEGATERILLPEIIKKVDALEGTTLRSKYLAMVEVGGAYAHHFYKFIDFLELKTLVITDLDAVKKTIGSQRTTYPAAKCSEATHSSNIGISLWFDRKGYSEFSFVKEKNYDEKEKGARRIAFQIPEQGSTICGRSFEDAFFLANKQNYKVRGFVDSAIETKSFEFATKVGNASKANFAIEHSVVNTQWNVPQYIREGLIWLNSDIFTEQSQNLGVTI